MNKRTKKPTKTLVKHRWHILVSSLLLGIFVFCFTVKLNYKTGAKTLDEFIAAMAELNENTPIENNDPLNPSFENYFNEHFPKDLWSRIKEKLYFFSYSLHLVSAPSFSLSYLVNSLDTAIANSPHYSEHEIIEANQNTQFIVIGRLHSALHSLVRTLEQLRKQELIDNNLKLINKDHFLIFMGGALNRSPFDLETLSILLQLKTVNPNQVILISGKHERIDFWNQHTVGQVIYTASNNRGKGEDLLSKLNVFFSKQPRWFASCIPDHQNNTANIIIFKALGSENNQVKSIVEEQFRNKHTENKHPGMPLKFKAIFSDIQWRDRYEVSSGLIRVQRSADIPEWALLSSPGLAAQKALGFKHDAFVVISCDEWPVLCRITLYNQHILTKETSHIVYDLVSGDDITLGRNLPSDIEPEDPPAI